MYRFLVVQDISVHSGLFASRETIMQRTMRICSFCNFHHSKIPKPVAYIQKRSSRTSVNPLGQHVPIKKKKQRPKNYAELLEVTDHVTSNKRAAVKKLNTSDLSILVNQADITMDKLHKLRDLKLNKSKNYSVSSVNTNNVYCDEEQSVHHENDYLHSPYQGTHIELYSDSVLSPHSEEYFSKIIGNVNDLEASSKRKAEVLLNLPIKEHHTSINKSKNQGKISIVSSETRKLQRTKHSNTSFMMKDYASTILAYVDVYLDCNLVDYASKMLTVLRKKIKQTKVTPCNSVHIYNRIMKGYASRKDFAGALQIYNTMKNDSVLPVPETYARLFEAFARTQNETLLAKLAALESDMKRHEISYNDIFVKSLFRQDQREYTLEAVRMMVPNFSPKYPPLKTDYQCDLINKVPLLSQYVSPVEGLLTMEDLQDNIKTQIEIECLHKVKINSIKKSSESVESDAAREHKEKLAALEESWERTLLAGFEKTLSHMIQKEKRIKSQTGILHPFFQVLKKEEYVDIMLLEVKQLAQNSQAYSLPLSVLYTDLGFRVFKRYEVHQKQKNGTLVKTIDIYMKYLQWYLKPGDEGKSSSVNNRTVWQTLEYENDSSQQPLDKACPPWTKSLMLNVGEILYKIIFEEIRIDPSLAKSEPRNAVPAFYTVYRESNGFLIKQVKPHPAVAQLYKDSQTETLMFDPTFLPTYIPPRPWTTVSSGGYLLSSTTFMRSKMASLINDKLKETPSVNLYPVFDSLNQLGSIPWRVNTPVLDIVLKVFQEGGSERLNVPQPPSVLEMPQFDPKDTAEEKAVKRDAMVKYKQRKDEMYSLWCDTLYKLSLANHFRDKVFWLPHNLDFRGRVYPIPPHLNHLTSDLGRSILMFAKGKPLGPNGLDWLKIHTINLTGFTKGCTVSEALEYANKNIDKILDSARYPLTGEMWWAKAEKQWQTLAACMDLNNALNSPDVESYVSHCPIHQDGSCNGLQHYAALGRDQIGAESVNLYPHNTPQDVYAAVANMIEERRKRDASNGNVIAQQLEGYIQRKVIKQTVMTTVYGVTKYGARHQILKQLKEKDFPPKLEWAAATYLVDTTFETLREMFKSAKQIQDWFVNCANTIVNVCGESLEWNTPLGLPVVQEYSKNAKTTSSPLSKKPDSVKHKNAFPPNFIHSLDSTHMMLTSLHCNHAGLTFVSVHDCFWTHANTVEIMNKICRQQFVTLHSEPILRDLSDFFIKRYLANKRSELALSEEEYNKHLRTFASIPKSGTFNITKVLTSTYFFC